MTTINQLSTLNELIPSDKIPVWSSNNGDTRALPVSVLEAYVDELVTTSIDNGKANAAAVGIAGTALNMGTYTGTTIPDNQTAKQNIQTLETAVEARVTSAALASATGASLVGVQIGAQNGDLDKVADTAGVPISFFGTIGTSDDSLVMQAAIDALDGTGIPLALTGDVTLRGTVYLGNNAIRFNGYTINCPIDATYTQRGTATRKNEAMLLTKSAAAAGYGVGTVAITFLDRARINAVRTAAIAANPITTALLLENVSAFNATDIELNSVSTGVFADSVNVLYIYAGVQNVTIDTIIQNRAIGTSQGGIFIVSRDASRQTQNINIGQIISSGDGVDEFVAIYNSASASADISDVHIGSIVCVCDGASAFLVSVFRNAGSFDATKMRNITIGTIKCEINTMALSATGTAPTIIKLDKCAPRIGKAEIEFNATFPGTLTQIVGIRGPDQATQTILPYVDDFSFRMNSTNTQIAGATDVARGLLDFGRFEIKGAGSGWKHGGRFIRTIADARVESIALDPSSNTFIAFDGVESVTGYVDGRMNNVYNFKGTHVINTNHITNTFWWFQNSTPATNWQNASPVSLSYDADVRISGAGTVSRIIFAQSNPTNPVPINVRYRASNPGGLTISNRDSATGKSYFPTGQYNAQIVNAGVAAVRREGTALTVTAGSITPVFDYHVILNGASIKDITGPNGAAPYDGQQVTLRANSGTITIEHNTSVAVTKTFTSTGANITVNDVVGVMLTYNLAAARWEVRP